MTKQLIVSQSTKNKTNETDDIVPKNGKWTALYDMEKLSLSHNRNNAIV